MIRDLGVRHPNLAIAGGVLLFAIGPSFIAASELDGPGFVFLRFAVGMPLMLGIVVSVKLRRRLRGLPSVVTLRSVSPVWTIVAGIAFASHHLSFMTAVKMTSVADAALLDALSPLFVMTLAFFMFGERPPPAFIVWSFVAMSGAGIVAVAGTAARGGEVVGTVLALWAVISFAVFFISSRAARPTSDTWSFLTVVTVLASAFIGIFFIVFGLPLPPLSSRELALAFALAVGSGALGHFLMTWPLDRVSVNVPPVMRLSTPFLATAIAWLVLGEPLGQRHLYGGLLTAIGVIGAIMTSERSSHIERKRPTAA